MDTREPDQNDRRNEPRGEEPQGGPEAPPGGSEGPAPRRLLRSRDDRMIAGICGGLGRYFGIDPVIFRIAAVALAFIGGAGLLLYLAGLVLVPDEATGRAADTSTPGGRALTALAVIGLAVGALALAGPGLLLGFLLVPLTVLALVGLAVWWLASGEGPGGSPGDVVRRSALGVGLLVVCGLIAFCGFWAAAAGGSVVVAAVVIAAGVALVASAFVGGARWLVLPALALALPAAFVSAAGIDLDGGIGEREYRPTSAADVRERYELGAGSLVVDLRDARLPAGDRPLSLEVGMGEAVLIVPEEVCVATRAEVGMGLVDVFERENGGVDVEWSDGPQAGAGTTRVVVAADIGLGEFEVRHTDFERHRHFGPGERFGDDAGDEHSSSGNAACSGGSSAESDNGAPLG